METGAPPQRAGIVLAAPAVVKWVGSSAGLGGILIGIGYIVVSAREALLGVELHDAVSTADYALVGGRFFADVVTLLHRRGIDYVIGFVLAVVVLGVLAFGALRFGVRLRLAWTPAVYLGAIVLVAVLLAVNWAYFDLPFAYIENVLLRGNVATLTAANNVAAPHVNAVWKLFRCAHSGRLRDERRCTAELEDRFLSNLLSTLVLITAYVSLSVNRSRLPAPRAEVTWRTFALAIRGASGLLILINLFGIPYVYGKSIRSTSFPSVSLQFGEGIPDQYRQRTGILLAATDQTLTFYDTEHHLVWEMPRQPLLLQQTLAVEDVLQRHFAMYAVQPKESP